MHGPNFSHPAFLCTFHIPHGGVGPLMCFLCRRVALENSSVPGRLCQHCGSGNHGNQCVAVERI